MTGLLIVAGQGMWALGQALVLILFSRAGEIELVGVIALALAIFGPIALLGSFNLRQLVAADTDRLIPLIPALVMRAGVALVGLALTLSVLVVSGASVTALVVVGAMLCWRIGDHVSDIAVGVYLRDGRRGKVAASYLVRGLAGGGVFVALILLGFSPVTGATWSAATLLFAVLLHDVAPVLRDGENGGAAYSRLITRLNKAKFAGPFPILDSLHLFSLRFGLATIGTTELVGHLGLAQTFYTPLLLASSTYFYGILVAANRFTSAGDLPGFRTLLQRGILVCLGLNLLFVLGALVAPLPILAQIYPPGQAELGRSVLIWAGVGLTLHLAAGMACLGLISRKLYGAYGLNPLVGIVVFWGLLGSGSLILPDETYRLVSMAFLASSAVRFLHAMLALRQSPAPPQASETSPD